MNHEEIIDKTKNFVKETMLKESSHDYYHVMRVYHTAVKIAEREGADLFSVSLASLLHDIADHKFYHGDSSVGEKNAEAWLRSLNVEEEIVDRVKEIVGTISFKAGTNKKQQNTIEGMVVQDADRLDAIGAIGIARTFAFGGFKNRDIYLPEIKPGEYRNYSEYETRKNHTINHFYEKLLLLKDLMNTETAKKIAQARHEFMETFLRKFYQEWDGEDIDDVCN